MRGVSVPILLLVSCSVALAQTSPPLCVGARDAMPESWRPSAEMRAELSGGRWSEREAADARAAFKAGLEEMLDLFEARPSAVPALWEDAVGALIELTYSTRNPPAINQAARAGAVRNLAILMQPYLRRDPPAARCGEYADVLPLAMYASRFYPAGDARTTRMVALANAAYRACGSLATAVGDDYEATMQDPDAATDDVFDLVIWSLLFIEAELIPGLDLPQQARAFAPTLWAYLEEDYRLPGADEFEAGPWDDEFIETAYLATHIAYIPTGNHRYPLYVEDMPSLYRYHRENFYPALEMGELDLVAEMVDSLRQYGCTASSDVQVRDGTRYLLKVFHDGDDSWMAYREDGQTDADVDDYDLVHKAWTGVLGVRDRAIEPAESGTYGGVVRRWLPHPR